jgi:hypothetical protein
MNGSWCITRVPTSVFARRCAGWLYGACWIARRGIGSGGVDGQGDE